MHVSKHLMWLVEAKKKLRTKPGVIENNWYQLSTLGIGVDHQAAIGETWRPHWILPCGDDASPLLTCRRDSVEGAGRATYMYAAWPSFRWNLAVADTHADLLSEKNIVRSLKSIINEQLHTASTNDWRRVTRQYSSRHLTACFRRTSGTQRRGNLRSDLHARVR
jgi:hypothetical protein